VSWGRYLGATRNLPPNTHPMMPVELGMTDWAPPGRLSALATAAQTASLSSTPPGAQTLEILLLMTIACTWGDSARRFRPTMTGAPGKEFDVNIAANLSVGLSSAMRVMVILAGRSGTSRGRNSSPWVPTRKPDGRTACGARLARYSSALA
jgi:hypothetical protein